MRFSKITVGEGSQSLKGRELSNVMPAWFYILRLKSGSLYIGATTDLDQRCKKHFAGITCRTTALDPPTVLFYSEEYRTFSEARRREAQIKRNGLLRGGTLLAVPCSSKVMPSTVNCLDLLCLLSYARIKLSCIISVKGSLRFIFRPILDSNLCYTT
jgi:putative endonuclease